MKTIKAIVSDLDGTLLNTEMTISPENCEAIEKIREKGIEFIISSGRAYSTIPRCVTENGNIRYICHSNGSTVFDKALGKNIIENYISKTAKQKALKIIDEYDTLLWLQTGGVAYFEDSLLVDGILRKYHVNASYEKVFREMPTVVGIRELAEESTQAENIALFFSDDGELLECKARLEKIEGISVTSSVEHNLELCSSSAEKGNTMLRLLNILNVSPENTIALGDNTNDVSMLEAAGLSVCTANANSVAKAAADVIGPSNDEHIAKFVYDNFL